MDKRKNCLVCLICLVFFVSCNFGISTDNAVPPYVDPAKDVTKVWFEQDIYFVNPGDVVDIKVHTDPELKDYRIPYSYSGGRNIIETLPLGEQTDFSVLSFKALDPGSVKCTVKINNIESSCIIVIGDYESWFDITPSGCLTLNDKHPRKTLSYLPILPEIKGIKIKTIDSISLSTNEYHELFLPEGIETINSLWGVCGDLVIPSSVRTIKSYALTCWLKSLVIKDGLTVIPEHMLSGYSGMEKLILPNTIETIGDKAFEGCTGLKSLDIPSSIKTMAPNALYDIECDVVIHKTKDSISGFPWGHTYPSKIKWVEE